jgi:hypothetical protein
MESSTFLEKGGIKGLKGLTQCSSVLFSPTIALALVKARCSISRFATVTCNIYKSSKIGSLALHFRCIEIEYCIP